MKVTEAMLDAALRKATEAGLFPRHCSTYEMVANREVMTGILQAALCEAEPEFMQAPLADVRHAPVLSVVRSIYK